MRAPIFTAGTNPHTSKPAIRKSLHYLTQRVKDGWADWVNPQDPTQGVLERIHHKLAPESEIERIAGSGFDTAWSIRQSGPEGPLVWQLKTSRSLPA